MELSSGLERNLMSQVWISCLKCRVVSVAQVAKCLAGQRINECRKLLKTQGISFNVFLDDWWVGSYVQQIEPNLLKLETAYMELTNQWLLTIISCLQLWFHGTLYLIRPKKKPSALHLVKALHPETVLASSRPQWRSRIQNHCCSWDFAPRSIRIQAHPGEMRNMRMEYFIHISIIHSIHSYRWVNSWWSSLKLYISAKLHQKQRPLWISTNNELLPPESISASDSSFESDNFLKVLWDAREWRYFVHFIIKYIISHCYIVTLLHHIIIISSQISLYHVVYLNMIWFVCVIISVQPKSDWATHLRAFNLESRGGKHAVFHDKTMQNNAWSTTRRGDTWRQGGL